MAKQSLDKDIDSIEHFTGKAVCLARQPPKAHKDWHGRTVEG